MATALDAALRSRSTLSEVRPARLTQIPGVDALAAAEPIAEIGVDMIQLSDQVTRPTGWRPRGFGAAFGARRPNDTARDCSQPNHRWQITL
jgi:hypothetical protein